MSNQLFIAEVDTDGPISEEDERFVRAYLETNNASRAARTAYGETDALRSRAIGFSKLKEPAIRCLLRQVGRPVLEATHITAERVMLQLARHAFRDPRRAFDDNGRQLPPHMLDDDTAASILSYETETKIVGKGDEAHEVEVTKVRFVDPTAALTNLAKHFKLVGDVGEGFDSLAAELATRLGAARKRVEIYSEGGGAGDRALLAGGALPPARGPTTPNTEAEIRNSSGIVNFTDIVENGKIEEAEIRNSSGIVNFTDVVENSKDQSLVENSKNEEPAKKPQRVKSGTSAEKRKKSTGSANRKKRQF